MKELRKWTDRTFGLVGKNETDLRCNYECETAEVARMLSPPALTEVAHVLRLDNPAVITD
jgi:hypothetical protein